MSWSQLPQVALQEMNQLLDKLQRHDVETYKHSLRVGGQSLFLARAAGMDSQEQSLAHISGLLHDVGKLKIPLNILNKPGRLSESEYEVMKHHVFFSAELVEPLTKFPFFKSVQQAVLHHHERVDGQGYPFELNQEEIPLVSKVILIVDTVDAMTADRAYRRGLPMEVVYRELRKYAGRQFDSELVETFIKAQQQLSQQPEPQAQVLAFPAERKVA